MKFDDKSAREKALHRAKLEAERMERARALDEKRHSGTLRGASVTRKRKKHGRR